MAYFEGGGAGGGEKLSLNFFCLARAYLKKNIVCKRIGKP